MPTPGNPRSYSRRHFLATAGGAALATCALSNIAGAQAGQSGSFSVCKFERGYVDPPIARAKRRTRIVVDITGLSGSVQAELSLPSGVKFLKPEVSSFEIPISDSGGIRLMWEVMASRAASGDARLILRRNDAVVLEAKFPVAWTYPVLVHPMDYVPVPHPADTGRYLIGAMQCPLWGTLPWKPITAYPDREPVLGWYDYGTPATVDWEIMYALDHGISFFWTCWYRSKNNVGKPVEKPPLGDWLQGLFKCQYGNQMKFAIIWILTPPNTFAPGISSAADLIDNVLPFWIDNYFARPNYMRFDGKPLLMIMGGQHLIAQIGGVEKTARAIAKMREICHKKGIGDLILVGENHNNPLDREENFKKIGLDYVTSYHWPCWSIAFKNPRPIIPAQELCWKDQTKYAAVPAIVTCSMGWDARPWGDKDFRWRLAPANFKTLLRKAKSFVDSQPTGSLESRMILLDNWDEFGEGHYIFPNRQYGFGYLDAVRDVFGSGGPPLKRIDLTPQDVGLGPYDRLFRKRNKETPLIEL